MKKRWLASTTILIGCAGLFFTPAGPWIVQQTLRGALLAYWGHEIKYERLYWENGSIVVNAPVLNEIKADSLKLSPHFNFAEKALEVQLHINRPTCKITPENIEDYTRLVSSGSGWLDIKQTLKVDDGVLEWVDGEDYFKVYYHLKKEPDYTQFLTQFDDVSFRACGSFLNKALSLEDTWGASDGIISGEVQLTLPSNGREPILNGNLTLSDILVFHVPSGIELSLKKANIALCEEEAHFSLPELATVRSHRHDRPTWLFGGVQGEFHLDPQFMAAFDISTGAAFNLNSHDYEIAALIPAIHAFGHINIKSKDPFDTLNANLKFKEATVDFSNKSALLPSLTDIEADLQVVQGKVRDSKVRLKFSGLKGYLDIDEEKNHHLVKMTLDGSVTDVADLFPAKYRKALHQTFDTYRIGVNSTIEELEMRGEIYLGEEGQGEKDIIHFGVDFTDRLKGWFFAKQLPLETYVSPFMFPTHAAELKGSGEFRGSFDSDAVVIHYDSDHISIENKHLIMERPGSHQNSSGELPGYQRFDLTDGSFCGYFPIENGSYFDKHHGLLFSGISAQALLEDGIVHLKGLEGYSNGIYFAGSLDFDYSDPAPGVFTVKLDLPAFHGKVSQAQHFFAHLHVPGLLEKLPIEGQISARSSGAKVTFDFSPDEDILDATLFAALADGSVDLPSLRASLKDLSADIDYEHKKNAIQFNELQGSLLFGQGHDAKEYLINGKHLLVHDLDKQEMDVDIRLTEDNTEVTALVGETVSLEDGNIEFHVNKELTHFGLSHPEKFELAFTPEGDLNRGAFSLRFNVPSFFKYIDEFRDTGWLYFSKQFIRRLAILKVEKGELALDLDYRDSLFQYRFQGKDIGFQNYQFNDFYLTGKKKEKSWIIDEFALDKLNLSAEISPKGSDWKLHHLGLKYGKNLLLGLEGNWSHESKSLLTEVNLFEWNLAEEESLQDWMESVRPVGQLKGTGHMNLTLSTDAPWFSVEAAIDSTLDGWKVGEFFFKQARPFEILFNTEQGIRLRDLEVALEDGKLNGCCEEIVYQPSDESLKIQGFDFKVLEGQLAPLVDRFYQYYPNALDPSTKEGLKALKPHGELSGRLHLEKEGEGFLARLQFPEGDYHYKGQDYKLQSTLFELTPKNLKLSTHSNYERFPFYIESHTDWPSLERGECILTDLSLSTANVRPIVMEWKSLSSGIYEVESLSGSAAGISCDIQKNSTGLEGKIELDMSRLPVLFSPSTAARLQSLLMSSLYTLEGKWQMQWQPGQSLSEGIHFIGKLNSAPTKIKTYELEKMEANLEGSLKQIKLNDLSIRDPSCSIHCREITLSENENESWSAWIPEIFVKDFRPTLLKDDEAVAKKSGRARNLLIRKIELKDFYGNLNDKSTWQAQGLLYFTNPSRKSTQNPLFTIPSELILRLGLDPQVLNPVSGQIFFNLRGDKFMLDKFKDVYSEGRGSKFYLDSQSAPSWVDLDGNLSVHVRMKQYNLIFKIAELFSVSIQGNVKKPKYSLEKSK